MSDSHEHAGFVAPDPAELAPLFPGYEIQSLIATGGMGAVYSAVQKSLDRMVALKILPREMSADATFRAGFEAEAKAMARLNHPNLIGVYDFGEANGMLYIIMEFVPGKSVYHATYGHAVDPAEAIRLVSAVCHGLAHAHENGILHRDIKPSNILLDLNGQPKIGDFGLARPADRKVEEGEEIFGTPHYTAPEVVNNPHAVDYRADIFSVGVLLHELLTGKLPAADPRPASAIIKCDPRFDSIIRRATLGLPAARYHSAEEIAAELQVIGKSKTRSSPVVLPSAAPPRPKKAARRKVPAQQQESSGPILGIIAILVVLGILAFLFISKSSSPKTVSDPVPDPVEKKEEPVRESRPARNTGLSEIPKSKPKQEEYVSPFGSTKPPGSSAGTDDSEEETEDDTRSAGSGGSTRTPSGSRPPRRETLPAAKFDVPGFFERARKIMQERARPQLATLQTGMKANVSDFEISVEKQTRRMKLNGVRVDPSISSKLARFKEEGKIPEELDSSFDGITDIESFHRAGLSRQMSLEDTFGQGVAQLSGTYILGLEKQIERLEGTDDPGAVGLISREIERTKDSPDYFRKLMLGDNPGETDDEE